MTFALALGLVVTCFSLLAHALSGQGLHSPSLFGVLLLAGVLVDRHMRRKDRSVGRYTQRKGR